MMEAEFYAETLGDAGHTARGALLRRRILLTAYFVIHIFRDFDKRSNQIWRKKDNSVCEW
jgi:hypothetical protein